MAAARTLAFESFPEWKLHLKYFCDVTNAVELAELITSGKLPENTAVINAKLVPGLLPLYAAADRTLRTLKYSEKGFSTRTMGSELVYNLSSSKHISEALKRFGVKDNSCTRMLVAWFEKSEDSTKEGDISNLVSGNACDLSELEKHLDEGVIKKYYKIQDTELKTSTLTDCVVFRVGARECLWTK